MSTTLKVIATFIVVACIASHNEVGASCCTGVRQRLQPKLTELREQQHRLMAEAINALQTIKNGIGMPVYLSIIIKI